MEIKGWDGMDEIIMSRDALVEFHIILMFDNFVEESYHPSDLVYTHQ
jgi:hypothetical protein